MVSVLRNTGCSSVVVRRDLVKDEQFTGKIQRYVLIDGTVRDVPVTKIQVSSPYYSGNADALCMVDPIYDLILGNIQGVRNPNEPDEFWKGNASERIENQEEEDRSEEGKSDLVTNEVSLEEQKLEWSDCKATDNLQSESTEETVHKGWYQERGHSLLDEKSTETTYPDTDIVQAVQARGQKLQEGKKFSTLKVLGSLKVNKDEFRSEQISCGTAQMEHITTRLTTSW